MWKNDGQKYLKHFASLKCRVNLQGIFVLPRNFTLPVPPHFMPKSMTLNDGLLLNSLMMASRFSPGGVDWSILQYLIARDVELASRQILNGKYIYIYIDRKNGSFRLVPKTLTILSDRPLGFEEFQKTKQFHTQWSLPWLTPSTGKITCRTPQLQEFVLRRWCILKFLMLKK